MEVSDAKRLRQLEDENRRLKIALADVTLKREALKGVIGKKGLELVSARRDVAFVVEQFKFSERHACRLLNVDRGSYRYEPADEQGLTLKEQLLELARQKPRYGYRRLWALLVKRGHHINIKRVYRWYREEKLALRRLKRKKLSRPAMKEALVWRPNQEWAMDFVFDRLETGRNLKLLTIVDGYTRESRHRGGCGARSGAGDASAGTGHRRTRRTFGAAMS